MLRKAKMRYLICLQKPIKAICIGKDIHYSGHINKSKNFFYF